MAKKQTQVDFPFYSYLQLFYRQEKKKISSLYKPLTRKFLAYNNPDNGTAYLRPPQFEALEMYVFLKEFCNNKFMYEIFEDWFYKRNRFWERSAAGITQKTGQLGMFGPSEFLTDDAATFQAIYDQIKSFNQSYPNYIFALTMGLGKTILMATSIFYEFLLANKFPQDKSYCHNALVFAPDKTVLYSLKEIQTFDKSRVVPPEYLNWLETHLTFFFLDDTGDALNAIENSNFNIIISNTQKIILKKQRKERSAAESLFKDQSATYKAISYNKDYSDLYDFDIDTDQDLLTNQRFAKLTRLKQLGIYVDEAHHVFGTTLAKDFGMSNSATSLRVTINELAANLKVAGTNVVGCYNYTGTPYVGNRLLPEVVYAYGLRDAIDNQYLKKVKIESYSNVKSHTLTFVRLAINEFWKAYKNKRFEKMLPKIAFFASSIDELQKELRPAVEKVLSELKISPGKILVNVGDDSITSNDDLREFRNLDSAASNKQFILLVNKGKEGWNCRSLFAVALHREPKSKIFVLQATMRCLRSIGEVQETGFVFLSNENITILNNELEENFRLSVDDLNNAGDNKVTVKVKVMPPHIKIRLKRIRKLHQLKDKPIKGKIKLDLDKIELDRYRIIQRESSILDPAKRTVPDKDVTQFKDKRCYSELTLIGEIARYLNTSPLRIKEVLASTEEGIEVTLEAVNEFNEVLYDHIIPKIFNSIFELVEYKSEEELEIDLVKEPKDSDCYLVKAKPELIASVNNSTFAQFRKKSFHLDNYCFDSQPENNLFWTLLNDKRIDKVWFTGMLTHGQTDFVINYIDPESHTLRSYYPDFLVKLKDDSYVIVEVKGDNKIDDAVVKAKAEYATQLALTSGMTYKMISGSDANSGHGIS